MPYIFPVSFQRLTQCFVTRRDSARYPMTELQWGDLSPVRLSFQVPVTFDDISIQFSTPEWDKLEERQKELYKNIMKGNYESLISMGEAELSPFEW